MPRVMPLNNKGFTLVETVIYVAIFSILVGGLTTLALQMSGSRLGAQAILEVNGQGVSALREITRSIRNASAVSAPLAGDSDSVLSVATINSSTSPTSFYVSEGVLYITEGANNPVALTNNKVRVTNMSFNNFTASSTASAAIYVRFTVSNIASPARAVEQYSIDFYGTASTRL